MSDFSLYSFWLLLLPSGVAYCFYRDYRYEKLVNEKEAVYSPGSGRVTAGYSTPGSILVVFPTIFVVITLVSSWQYGLSTTGELAMHLMAVALLYYPLLLLVLPLLRRVVSARCCAVLGTLPAYLFISGAVQALWLSPPPQVVVRLPRNYLPLLVGLWLAGGAALLLWKTVGHLRFRRALLTGAEPVTDGEILELWDYEQQRIERKKDQLIPLVVSPGAASPVTVGLWQSRLVTVLPRRAYTLEELELIFRHELRHVQRRDSSTKLFYTFCLAFCWFDPFLWLAARSAAADLELSCDEMVLDRSDEGRREQYARLLLSQAGDDRGFSTCLSGSARTLQHRLKSVLHPRRRLPGTLLVGLVMAALLAVASMVRITGAYGTVKEVVLDRLPGAHLVNHYVEDTWDQEAVMAALNELEVTRLSTVGDFPTGTQLSACFDLWGDGYQGRLYFSKDGYLRAYADRRYGVSGLYRVEGEVDWEALRIPE